MTMYYRMPLVVGLALAAGFGCAKTKSTEMGQGSASTSSHSPSAGADHSSPATREEAIERMQVNFLRSYFEFDSSTLSAESRSALAENARIMQQFPSLRVEVQGHADARGTTEYNLTLGQKRAEAVAKYLVTSGVPAERVITISFGKEKPLLAGAGEAIWSKNRRAEFRIAVGKTVEVAGTVPDDDDDVDDDAADSVDADDDDT